MQDQLIVATPERVNVYTDLRLAMDKLDAEVAAAPKQPEPRLRYAEIMFVAGKWDVALAKLDEAMQLLGGAGAGTASSPRARPRCSPTRSRSRSASPGTARPAWRQASALLRPRRGRGRHTVRSRSTCG